MSRGSVGNLIEPAVFESGLPFARQGVQLNALVVLISLSAWGIIWGVAGMVLSVPMTCCMRLVCHDFYRRGSGEVFGMIDRLLSGEFIFDGGRMTPSSTPRPRPAHPDGPS